MPEKKRVNFIIFAYLCKSFGLIRSYLVGEPCHSTGVCVCVRGVPYTWAHRSQSIYLFSLPYIRIPECVDKQRVQIYIMGGNLRDGQCRNGVGIIKMVGRKHFWSFKISPNPKNTPRNRFILYFTLYETIKFPPERKSRYLSLFIGRCSRNKV